MKIYNINDMTRGWFIGNFEPSVVKTDKFEVGLFTHFKNELWPKHFHKEAEEINLLISGHMKINNIEIFPGDIFHIEKNEIADPEFLQDCKIMCVKFPSVPGDKYEVDRLAV